MFSCREPGAIVKGKKSRLEVERVDLNALR
jgi:hypothetical protein